MANRVHSLLVDRMRAKNWGRGCDDCERGSLDCFGGDNTYKEECHLFEFLQSNDDFGVRVCKVEDAPVGAPTGPESDTEASGATGFFKITEAVVWEASWPQARLLEFFATTDKPDGV